MFGKFVKLDKDGHLVKMRDDEIEEAVIEEVRDELEQYYVRNTTKLRYGLRRKAFVRRFGKLAGNVFHHFWWVTHNCVVHPLIGFVPLNVFFKIHDYTSNKLNEW